MRKYLNMYSGSSVFIVIDGGMSLLQTESLNLFASGEIASTGRGGSYAW